MSHHKKIRIYCDESEDRGGHDVLGGIWVSQENAARLEDTIQGIRERNRYPYEFKWNKVSGSRVSGTYRDLIDKTMQFILARRMAFNCIVVRRGDVDLATFHEGDHELRYYKFLTLLLRQRAEPGCRYHIFLDRRTMRRDDRLSDLQRVLNLWTQRDLGLRYDCCSSVEAANSKKVDLLQVADLLIGAVGYHVADDHLQPNASEGKIQAADLIAGAIGRKSLATKSPKYEPRFNVWRWVPRQRD